MDLVADVARAVLYEGYVLWPYRRSSIKNQQRWTFGGVHPEAYSRARGEDDPWLMQTECLVEGDATAAIDVHLRFLHLVQRRTARCGADGLDFVDELQVGDERHVSWEEATERQILALGRNLAALATPERIPIVIPAGEATEWLADASGARVGAMVRSWCELHGVLELRATPLADRLFRFTARIMNHTRWRGERRDEALRRTFVSTHTILRAAGGAFVSLMAPPPELRVAARECRNIGTWPVLAGVEGTRDTMLSSPIILYDYPRIAPESTGDLFDATEIDQLLVLNVLSLTEDEQREVRETDPYAREILDRCLSLTPEQLMRMHGAVRELRPVREQ